MAQSIRHYGILGMKWGRRKSSYDTSSEDHRSVSQLRKKKLSEMSNEEIRKLTTRLQLERSYKDLTKREVSSGEKFVKDLMKEIGKEKAKDFAVNVLIPNVVPKIQDVVEMGVAELLKRLARG